MKIFNKIISASAVALAAFTFGGCMSETPFAEEGEGTLKLNAELRGDITAVVTRAADYDRASLENNLVVYIQKENVGVVRKFIGLESLRDANIALQTGRYVLEGWTGDSVSASFEKKFYYGYLPVDIAAGANSISLKCDIANVLVSVNSEYVADKVSDLKMEVWSTKGKLTFDNEMLSSDRKGNKKGYFMMPKGESSLTYKLSGKNTDGTSFESEEKTFPVLKAHDYQFVLKADASQITQGGALIKLEIVEVPVIDEEVTVLPAPSFKATMGENTIDLSKQLNFYDNEYSDINLRVLAYKGMSSLKLSFSENFPSIGGVSGLDVIKDGTSLLPASIATEMISKVEEINSDNYDRVEVVEYWFTFPASYISSLPASSSEYAVKFEVEDGKGFTNEMQLRFANTEEAIERLAPIGSYTPDEAADMSAVSARSATLYGVIYDESVTDFGIRVREQGASTWTSYPGTLTRAENKLKKFFVEVSGLKAATTYEYKSYAGDFEEENANTFTTESAYVIPGASFEEWSTYSASTLLGTKTVTLPGNTGDKLTSYWGSGNEGAATANLTLTSAFGDLKHSGRYSARLASNAAMGVIAAGNIFTGYYVKTDGTNGVLSVGREYNGSHPSKLRVFANYRPGSGVKLKSGNEDYVEDMKDGGTDQGQIYVALTTGTYEIRTNPSDRRLFNREDASVVAYGQVTWKEAFGADGELKEVEIPIEYKANAKTLKPTHLVIVCSASKFGDYFCGSSSSVMIVDDFELVYE